MSDSEYERTSGRDASFRTIPNEKTALVNGYTEENEEEEEQFNPAHFFRNWNYETLKKRAPYYIPVLGWLPKYTKKEFLADTLAGITISCILIPQSLGLASLALLPPIYGLYTAFSPLLLYSFLGTSRHLQVGPEAAVSLMTGQLLASITEDDTAYPGLAHTVAFFVGIFALIAGFLRLGFLDSILSKAMGAGFLTAVAFVIMSEQLESLFGIEVDCDAGECHEATSSTIEKLIWFFQHIHQSNPSTVALGLSGLAFLFIFNAIKNRFSNTAFFKFFPFVLFLVVISILITWGFRLDEKHVVILGDIEGGFQTPAQFRFDKAGELITGSLLIMIIGFIESVVCTKRFADKNGYGISDNRELVALGAANTVGGIFGAYPAFGALSRTNLNDAAGGKTQVVSMIAATVIMFTILFLLPLFYYLPKCIMAAVVFFAGFGLLEFDNLKFLWKIRAYQDIFLFFVTAIVTLAVSIQIGVLVSIGLSLGLVVKDVTGPTFNVIGVSPGGKYKPVEDGPDVEPYDDIIIVRFKDSLFYAKIGFMSDRFRRVEKYRTLSAHPADNHEPKPLVAVIIDVSRMRAIDASALKVLTEIIKDYAKRGIRVCIVKLSKENKNKFKKAGITEIVGEGFFFNKINEAVIAVRGKENRTDSNASLPGRNDSALGN